MTDPVMKLQILTRAEMTLAQIRVQRALRRAAFFAVAMVFGLLGLGGLDYAIFYAINKTQGPAVAALAVSLMNIAVAVVMLIVADRSSTGMGEEKLAKEIRDIAHQELSRDVEQVRTEVEKITNDVRMIRSSISTVTGVAAGTVVPLAKMLGKGIRRK
jgi:hypothetical protein